MTDAPERIYAWAYRDGDRMLASCICAVSPCGPFQTEYVRADLATLAPAVKVKALVWEERRNGYWQAVGTGYQIAHNQGDVYRVRLRDKVICCRIKGFENAKHWVFARHSAAILSALGPATPLNDPRVLALVEKARAVVDRWDSPLWKDLPHTGESIADLRAALETIASPSVATPLDDPLVKALVDSAKEVKADCIARVDKNGVVPIGRGAWDQLTAALSALEENK